MTLSGGLAKKPTTKRLLILRRILDLLASIQCGAQVTLPNGAVHTYASSVGLVTTEFLDITNMDDGEFPAVFAIPDDQTTFETDADGWTADATWSLSIVCNVKGDVAADTRDHGPLSITVEAMELLFQDVCCALLSDFFLGQPVDTVLTVGALVPNPFTDPGYAQAVVDVQIAYTHNFFE